MFVFCQFFKFSFDFLIFFKTEYKFLNFPIKFFTFNEFFQFLLLTDIIN